MKDESLIEEMRVALRDDQDRAKARRAARLDCITSPVDVIPTTGLVPAPTLRSRLGRLVGRGRSTI
jgi:hypothetical protein